MFEYILGYLCYWADIFETILDGFLFPSQFLPLPIAMDQIKKLTEPGRQFAKDSIRLVKRCTKPDRKGNLISITCKQEIRWLVTPRCLHVTEFQKIAIATAIGFCIMGFIGFFVKLIHIPINNIIV